MQGWDLLLRGACALPVHVWCGVCVVCVVAVFEVCVVCVLRRNRKSGTGRGVGLVVFGVCGMVVCSVVVMRRCGTSVDNKKDDRGNGARVHVWDRSRCVAWVEV